MVATTLSTLPLPVFSLVCRLLSPPLPVYPGAPSSPGRAATRSSLVLRRQKRGSRCSAGGRERSRTTAAGVSAAHPPRQTRQLCYRRAARHRPRSQPHSTCHHRPANDCSAGPPSSRHTWMRITCAAPGRREGEPQLHWRWGPRRQCVSAWWAAARTKRRASAPTAKVGRAPTRE